MQGIASSKLGRAAAHEAFGARCATRPFVTIAGGKRDADTANSDDYVAVHRGAEDAPWCAPPD